MRCLEEGASEIERRVEGFESIDKRAEHVHQQGRFGEMRVWDDLLARMCHER
jgi:hypothetical protein